MPTKRLFALLGVALVASPTMAAQTDDAAVTPVETIQLNGRVLPLNIKTLADLQRVNEEIDLQEKLKDTLKKSRGAPSQAPAPIRAPASAKVPASAKAPAHTLVAVYGTAGNMRAQIRAEGSRTIVVKQGDNLGQGHVKRIGPDGLTLVMGNGSTRQVQIGQRAVY